jgi:hypothetical protein
VLERAYRKTVREFQDLWASVDPDEADPTVLAAVSQTLARVTATHVAAVASASGHAATATALRGAILSAVGQSMLGGLASPLAGVAAGGAGRWPG